MLYKYDNREGLLRLHIHDYQFLGYRHSYDDKNVSLYIKDPKQNDEHMLLFQNVVLLYMQSCSFWHGGDSVMWLTVKDNDEQMDALERVKTTHPDHFLGSTLDKGIPFLIIEVVLNSGDTLLIACEAIEIGDEFITRVKGDGLREP